MQDAADGTMDFAVTYSMAGAMFTTVRVKTEHQVLDGSVAGFTIGVGSRSVDGSDAKANDVGVSYTLANGIKSQLCPLTELLQVVQKQKPATLAQATHWYLV